MSEIKDFIDAGDVVYNEMIDLIWGQLDENKKSETFGQPPLPYAVAVKKFVEQAGKRAHEAHTNAVYYSRDTHGSADDWADKAISRFRDNLLRMIRSRGLDSVLKDHLQSQVWELWPELLPPRDLTAEELAELCSLQEQSEIIIDNMKESIQTGVDGLWAIATAEQKITANTSAYNMSLIHRRTKCRLAALAGIIPASWDNKTSAFANPPEQIERHYMLRAPCRWVDERKGRMK